MNIWIARHGRTEANAGGLLLGRADPALDEVGREQARQIAAALPADALAYSSPLRRTHETAQALGVEVVLDDRLLELDYGSLDLTPVKDVPAETWARWRADPHFAPPGGESLADLALRVGDLLDELSNTVVADDVVLFTHVSPIKAVMAWALGVGIEISWRCHVAQASISKAVVSERGASLHLFNDTSHLGDISAS
jgi:broad specificity phosphatase PhoE